MDMSLQQKLESFFKQYTFQQYKKGDILIRADEDPTGVLYLKQGRVKKYAISHKGDEVIINMFKPISFFPMSWAINGTHNLYFYEAVTDSECFKAPKEKTITYVRNNTDVLYDLLSRVYKGTDGMESRMTYLMAGSAYTRLITDLLIHAKRFGIQEKEKVTMTISEKELAAMSGMSRETVSREMKVLKEKKLLAIEKGTIVISHLDALEEELAEGV